MNENFKRRCNLLFAAAGIFTGVSALFFSNNPSPLAPFVVGGGFVAMLVFVIAEHW